MKTVLSLGVACSLMAWITPIYAQGTAPSAPPPDPLEQMQSALISVGQQAIPAVVTIEGRTPSAKFFRVIRPRMPAIPKRASRPQTNRKQEEQEDAQADAEVRKADKEAQAAQKVAEKALREAQKQLDEQRIELDLSTPVTGSGFLLQGGFVVTTAEVASGLRDINIVTMDGQHMNVDWIEMDSRTNVAVLKVAGVDPKIGLRWGDSSKTVPGCFSLLVGNQAGFPGSFGWGMVAGTGRAGRSGPYRYTNLIQFQGPVGTGGSGGPLLNIRGEVVGMIVATPAADASNRLFRNRAGAQSGRAETGMPVARHSRPSCKGQSAADDPPQKTENTDEDEQNARQQAHRVKVETDDAIGGEDAEKDDVPDAKDAVPPAPPAIFMFGGVANTGFALPANDIRPIVENLCKRVKPVTRQGWLGVTVGDPPDGAQQDGALVETLYIGSPADKAGLREGDLVVTINGQEVRSAEDLQKRIVNVVAGEALRLEVLRGKQRLTLTLTIEPRPESGTLKRMPRRNINTQTGLLVPAVYHPKERVLSGG